MRLLGKTNLLTESDPRAPALWMLSSAVWRCRQRNMIGATACALLAIAALGRVDDGCKRTILLSYQVGFPPERSAVRALGCHNPVLTTGLR